MLPTELFEIDKDTTVYTILSSVLHDPYHFEKPDAFHPGHFLDLEGNFRKQEAFILFSMALLPAPLGRGRRDEDPLRVLASSPRLCPQ